MNVKLKRLLLPLLRAVKEGRPISFRMKSAASQALFLIGKPTAKKTQGRLRRKSEKQSARASRKQETAQIREAVFRRAVMLCEVPGCVEYASDLDHWLSGSGRRREKQSFENCWALCVECHLARTNNAPTAAYWNEMFEKHCRRHGFNFIPHIIHAEPAKAGGAP